MYALIFGHTGQDGYYLSRMLLDKGIQVQGCSRTQADCDISNFAKVQNSIRAAKPDYIFHLAANSTTRHDALFDNHAAIATGTSNILEAARLHAPHARIFIAGSAMQFLNNGQPIDETTAFAPTSPYATARIYATYQARYYRTAFGLKAYVGYFFNHDSPLRTEAHVNQKIAQAAVRIAAGSDEKLLLGNISVRKEFMFAADAVAAAWALINQDSIFEAVIGTGQDYSIEDWVAQCFSCVGLTWQDHVLLREKYTPEYTRLVSNPALMHTLGWRPQFSFNALARIMVKKDDCCL
ncbi:GDP-mannose 4,6-dehydratase [uncultured Desulfovibrio sp.]|uniref:GDP-mannose 4,6-dehydratase n=1 Tax=uncultured Desulfovibrio sp. TaxID=167968 RepID=UPI00265EA3E8|nr:GDP-mannose 4,6-dehydratase [uncultured Desulfovibrio sp.]